jgi:hypothetical protein
MKIVEPSAELLWATPDAEKMIECSAEELRSNRAEELRSNRAVL